MVGSQNLLPECIIMNKDEIKELIKTSNLGLVRDIRLLNLEVARLLDINRTQEETNRDLMNLIANNTSLVNEVQEVADSVQYSKLIGEPASIGVIPAGDGVGQVINVDRVFHRFRPVFDGEDPDKIYFTKGSWWYTDEAGNLAEAELSDDYTALTVTWNYPEYIIATLDRNANTLELSVETEKPDTPEEGEPINERIIAELKELPEGDGELPIVDRVQLGDIAESLGAHFLDYHTDVTIKEDADAPKQYQVLSFSTESEDIGDSGLDGMWINDYPRANGADV